MKVSLLFLARRLVLVRHSSLVLVFVMGFCKDFNTAWLSDMMAMLELEWSIRQLMAVVIAIISAWKTVVVSDRGSDSVWSTVRSPIWSLDSI